MCNLMNPQDKQDLIKLAKAHLARTRKTPGVKTQAENLFDYLVDDYWRRDKDPTLKPPEEGELAFSVFNRGHSPDAALQTVRDEGDSIVRKTMGDLRKKLKTIDRLPEARAHPIGIRAPSKEERGENDKPYRIEFYHRSLVMQFWRPYLSEESKKFAMLVYTENLFFRNKEQRFVIRHLDVNNDIRDQPSFEVAVANLKAKCNFLEDVPGELHVAYQFTGSGTISAVLVLTRWLERIGTLTEHKVFAGVDHEFVASHDCILFGSCRTFPFFETLNEDYDFNFVVERDGILNRRPKEDPRELAGLKEKRSQNGQVQKHGHYYSEEATSTRRIRGLVQRIPLGGNTITLISSNNGRFHEAAAEYLTNEELIANSVEKLRPDIDEPIADSFELLLEAKLDKYEKSVRPRFEVELIAIRTEVKRSVGGPENL